MAGADKLDRLANPRRKSHGERLVSNERKCRGSQWRALCVALGRPDLGSNSEFSTTNGTVSTLPRRIAAAGRRHSGHRGSGCTVYSVTP